MVKSTTPIKSESDLQAQFWKWAWNTHEEARHLMWAVPNDAIGDHLTLKDVLRSNELKATGLLSGVWDLHLFWRGQLHIIETKLPGAQLTRTRIVRSKAGKERKVFGQHEWGELMATHGAHRHIYHTLEEGMGMFSQIISLP